jgi:hypothetical protein
MFGKSGQSLLISQRLQLLADHCPEQAPELVGRVRIILPRGE